MPHYSAAMHQRLPRDPLLTTAMLLFTAGLLALGTAFVLFAIGHRNLPTWLSLASLLLPIGLVIGVARTRRAAHRKPPPAQED